MDETQAINGYDRLYGAMHQVALFVKPSTIKLVQFLTGRSESYIIQTCRHEGEDYVFVERTDEHGSVRIALPPKVANAIAAQRSALTKRSRSIRSKAAMRDRMDAGWKPSFQKKEK